MLLFCAVLGASPGEGSVPRFHLDEELIPLIGQGDGQALTIFYHQTEKALYAYLLSMLRDPEDTQDVMQDTYLKIRSCAHLYQPQGKPMAWIFTIARNLALMKLRQRRRQGELPPAEELENSLRFSVTCDREDAIVLQAALGLLEETERQIVLLFAVSGMKHREIAAQLGLPLSTVLSKYHRSLKKLRKYLEEKEALS
ncbi:RNA polymerase sigma factor [Angelakisella massiliensis]|uniref:RNA polymerase sigma factor n=1 Tax=Angelakisella massiliensis TaxID=1871018 RepID=UPI0008F95AD4|nr:RNA polymerase sigma factor [Angelakisella massiliensis]